MNLCDHPVDQIIYRVRRIRSLDGQKDELHLFVGSDLPEEVWNYLKQISGKIPKQTVRQVPSVFMEHFDGNYRQTLALDSTLKTFYHNMIIEVDDNIIQLREKIFEATGVTLVHQYL